MSKPWVCHRGHMNTGSDCFKCIEIDRTVTQMHQFAEACNEWRINTQLEDAGIEVVWT